MAPPTTIADMTISLSDLAIRCRIAGWRRSANRRSGFASILNSWHHDVQRSRQPSCQCWKLTVDDRTKFPRPQSATIARARHPASERTPGRSTIASIACNRSWRSRRTQSNLNLTRASTRLFRVSGEPKSVTNVRLRFCNPSSGRAGWI